MSCEGHAGGLVVPGNHTRVWGNSPRTSNVMRSHTASQSGQYRSQALGLARDVALACGGIVQRVLALVERLFSSTALVKTSAVMFFVDTMNGRTSSSMIAYFTRIVARSKYLVSWDAPSFWIN